MKSIFRWKTIKKKLLKKTKTSEKKYLHLVNRNVSVTKEITKFKYWEILYCFLSSP